MRYAYRVPPRIFRLFLTLDSCRWSGFVGAWCDLAADVVAWWGCWRVPSTEEWIAGWHWPRDEVSFRRRVPRERGN